MLAKLLIIELGEARQSLTVNPLNFKQQEEITGKVRKTESQSAEIIISAQLLKASLA